MLRHNIRDITDRCLSEVCHNVAVEPELQPLIGERLKLRTANSEEGTWLDVSAQVFLGGRGETSTCIFHVRIFNPYAPSNCKSTQTAVYRRHENEKRRSYQQ